MWSSGRSAARRALVAFGRRRVHVLADDARPGVFGLEGLHAPDDFSRLASAAVRRSEDIRASLASGAVAGVSVVDHLDEISDAVCSVVDVAELCRNVHPDPAWVDAANRAYVSLQGYVQGLNADRGLYDALVRAQRDASASASASGSFTPEAARVALTLRHDFERGGIHLDGDARARLERASADALRAAMRFQSNLADPAALGVARVPRSRLAGLPPTILGRLTGDATTATVPLDQHTLAACLRWVEDEDARRDVYAAAHAGPEANVDALRRLLTARAEVAEWLGFQSHAHYAVAPLLAGHPDAVRGVLREMAERTEDRAREENALARRFLPGGGRGGGGGSRAGSLGLGSGLGGGADSDADPFDPSDRHAPLRAWDRAYAMGRARTATCGVDASAVARYFPLESTIRGVGALVSRVFGVIVEEHPLDDAEKWCDDAKKLTLRTRDGDLLGTVYLDLSRRARKFPHAAHFVVRCSRDAREGPASRKRPVVALVCNFGTGVGASAGALLSHGEVETFLHEFGHAMHSALSETKYQHLSGTRCAADLVEVPSHLFEYFAWDPDALRILSRERTTGEPMPPAMIDALRRGKEMFGATDLRQQIAFALADLDAHSAVAADVDPQKTSAAFADAARSAGFRPEPGAAWELRFGHLVGYASTYYSYVYARCFAAEARRRWFAGDALAPGAGEAARDGLLRHGGAVAPERLLRDVLGEDGLRKHLASGGIAPNPNAALAELGAR